MVWVLYTVMYLSDGTSVGISQHTPEFNTAKACLEAKKVIDSFKFKGDSVCYPKGVM